jgi:hypothetical protein
MTTRAINPTAIVNTSFYDYVQATQERLVPHMLGGIPDYAYREDYAIRKGLKKIPGFVPIAKILTGQVVPSLLKY